MTLALLVPGGSGQLGRELAGLATSGVVHAPSSAELDIAQPGAVIEAVTALAERAQEAGLPPVVINAAAYTAVDQAEADAGRAFRVNGDGPRVLAAACASYRVPLVHLSTDYVFAGDADKPYDVDSQPAPRSVYGATKLAGEDAVLHSGARSWVVRTAWVYGAHGANFVKTMARLEGERATVSVVDDQHGSPTWTGDLARALLALATAVVGTTPPTARILHLTGSGTTTWYGFARAVFEELGADPDRVTPCTTADYPRPAPRPAYSVLSDRAWRDAGFEPLQPWRAALSQAFAEHPDAWR